MRNGESVALVSLARLSAGRHLSLGPMEGFVNGVLLKIALLVDDVVVCLAYTRLKQRQMLQSWMSDLYVCAYFL